MCDRIAESMGRASKSIEMVINHSDEARGSAIARDIVIHSNDRFEEHSRRMANSLTSAQTRRGLPGGLLVVFTGQIVDPPRCVVGVVKAEFHSGFRFDGDLNVSLFDDLFLGPQAKLYKIGLFTHDGITDPSDFSAGWEVAVFDEHLEADLSGAAAYFYESFLGCGVAPTGPAMNKRFYLASKDFIENANIPIEESMEITTSLGVVPQDVVNRLV